jgi:RHS repeat-associated protein
MYQNVAFASAYNYNGQRTGLSATIGETPDFLNSYSYGALGDMIGITQSGQEGGNSVTGKSVAMSYDAAGLMLGDNFYVTSSGTTYVAANAADVYNGDSQLTGLSYSAQGSTLASYQWAYNLGGEVTQELSSADASSGSIWGATEHSYDNNRQLTGTTYINFANTPGNSSQTFDSNGNRTSTDDTSEASSTNRLLYDGNYYYNYDANGNRTAKYMSTSGAIDDTAGEITIYKWNNAGELTSVLYYSTWTEYNTTPDEPDTKVDYGYGPFGEMVSRSPTGIEGESDEYFVNDGQNVALILNASGGVVERELYVPAVDQIMASENGSTGAVSWMLPDNQGTVRDVAQFSTGESGGSSTNIVNHLVYASFGQITHQTADAVQPTFTYQGMWQDPSSTGLDYTGANWYDAANGVFVSPTGAGLAAGATNPTEFEGNSPTSWAFGNPFGACVGTGMVLCAQPVAGQAPNLPARKIPENLPKIVQDLGSTDYFVREHASKDLAAVPPTIEYLEELASYEDQANDFEVSERIKRALNELWMRFAPTITIFGSGDATTALAASNGGGPDVLTAGVEATLAALNDGLTCGLGKHLRQFLGPRAFVGDADAVRTAVAGFLGPAALSLSINNPDATFSINVSLTGLNAAGEITGEYRIYFAGEGEPIAEGLIAIPGDIVKSK